jgi:hypothetical protein
MCTFALMLTRPCNRRRLAWLLFTLFALMQVNLVVFRHGHRLPDGRIITHAHPFWPTGKGPIQPNHHSAGELALLDAVANAPFVGEPPALIDFQPLASPESAPDFFWTGFPTSRSFFCSFLRGPPAVQ